MPTYRIHRLREHLRPGFRSAAHVSGAAAVKPRDYEPGETVEASSPYAAYFAMRDLGSPLQVGDLVEIENGALRICKFVGFEEANWLVPEVKTEPSLVGAGAVE
jgi:hypothetical protein